MFKFNRNEVLLTVTIFVGVSNGWNGYPDPNECGPYGFTCERNNRVRICDETKPTGPTFICPVGTFCNEESTTVCEDAINHLDPALTKKIRCQRNERIVNANVPGCKGYILCVVNGNGYQGVNFRCPGDTIFNGLTRSCTSSKKYKCPLGNSTKATPELYPTNSHRDSSSVTNRPGTSNYQIIGHRPSSIECKNYKFRVTQDDSPSRATYFCPPRPARGEETLRCTIFSNHFCITLEKDDQDQYLIENTPKRRPRM